MTKYHASQGEAEWKEPPFITPFFLDFCFMTPMSCFRWWENIQIAGLCLSFRSFDTETRLSNTDLVTDLV